MDPKDRKVILDNLDELTKLTQNIDDIIGTLYESGTLNEFMVEYLNKYHELRKKAEEFYLMIQGRGPNAFEQLLCVLRRTENFRVETLLSGHKCNAYNPEASLPSALDELDIGQTERDTKLVTIKPSEIMVKKHPLGKFLDSNDEKGSREAYRMRSNPRGYALIINIYQTPGKEDRRGSDIDMNKLCKLFKELGFEVIPKIDLTDEEIRTEIADLKAKPGLAKVDCLVVFIMCHGRQQGKTERSTVELLAHNGVPIDTNWLALQFQSDHEILPFFKGKPKMFFFQACRTNESGSSSQRYDWHLDIENEATSKSNTLNGRGQPPYGDTVLGFSTIPGNYSIRDPKNGSWFVETFCEVIAENAWQHDFDHLWSQIDEKMKEKACELGYQTPELTKRGFSKRLFFNPHLFQNSSV